MFTRPKDKTILSFSGSPTVALARLLQEKKQKCNAVRHSRVPPPPYRHYRHCPPPRPFASVRFDPLAWSSGSDQRRISGCRIRWLLAGPDSLPLWLCRVCAFVLLRCFSCSHTVLPKEHSLGIIFFSSLSSCKCCIFLQFYLHFTTDYTCMIVYVTNNKEPEPEPEPEGAWWPEGRSSFLLSLSVFAIMLLKRLPDGSKRKRWLLGWVESLRIFAALLLQHLR